MNKDLSCIIAVSSLIVLGCAPSAAQTTAEPAPTISSLFGVKPKMPDLREYVVDLLAAQQLGKALFWDIAVGSDGMACASCHFHAGVDVRLKNQMSPGLLRNPPDKTFSNRRDGTPDGPNVEMRSVDFPLHELTNANDRESAIKYSTNDVMSSAGTFAGKAVSNAKVLSQAVKIGKDGLVKQADHQMASQECQLAYDPTNNPFHANGWMYRKVEPRHSPTNIGAIFYHRGFWDGRANNRFNGVDPFGDRTNKASAAAGVLFSSGSKVQLRQISIENAAMASQGVGPVLSTFEMACEGLKFADVARKLLPRAPLGNQLVHPNDSLFSRTPSYVSTSEAMGLRTTYAALVRKGFSPKLYEDLGRWTINSDGTVKNDPRGHTQMEHNFSLFFGISVMLYQALLIPDQSPFDKGPTAMSSQAKSGQDIFSGKGKCINCHNGPLFSNATQTASSTFDPVERMTMGDGGTALYDTGFYNIGVKPTVEDLGLGATDPYGNPLSFSRQYAAILQGKPYPADSFSVNPCKFEVPFDSSNCSSIPPNPDLRVAVDGAMKVPVLRNIGTTPPYLHDGSASTLEQVVAFYNRGGNRRKNTNQCGDTTGYGNNCSNVDPDIESLGLSGSEQANLVAFLKSLTDNRVACHQGPFDHPELPLPNGHPSTVNTSGTAQRASDIIVKLPATGRDGLPQKKLPCFPNSGNLFGDMQTAFKAIAK